jgi:hypothetical protein
MLEVNPSTSKAAYAMRIESAAQPQLIDKFFMEANSHELLGLKDCGTIK